MKDLITTKQLAQYLQLKPVTVRRKVAKEEIPAIKIGRYIRFDKTQIDKWLKHSNIKKLVQVLVIGDEPMVGDIVRATIGKKRCQVATASSSLEALKIITKNHFDMIFFDLEMPELDASELIKLIRQEDRTVPVVIVTDYPHSSMLDNVMKYGPVMVLKKSFQVEDIVATIRRFNQGFYHEH